MNIKPKYLSEYIRTDESSTHVKSMLIREGADLDRNISGVPINQIDNLMARPMWYEPELSGFNSVMKKATYEFKLDVTKKVTSKSNKGKIMPWIDSDDTSTEAKVKKSKELIPKIEEIEKPLTIAGLQLPSITRDSYNFGISSSEADLVLITEDDQGLKYNLLDIRNSWNKKPSYFVSIGAQLLQLEELISEYDNHRLGEVGIINRDDYEELNDLEKLDSIKCLDTFKNIEQLINDAVFYLSEDEKLKTDLLSTDNTRTSMSSISNSRYKVPIKIAQIMTKDLSLAGVDTDEQKALNEIGIRNLEDLTQIIPSIEDRKHVNVSDDFAELDLKKGIDVGSDEIAELHRSQRLDRRIERYAQVAQAVLGMYKKIPWAPEVSEQAEEASWSNPGSYMLPVQSDSYIDIPPTRTDIDQRDVDSINVEDPIFNIYLTTHNDPYNQRVFCVSASVYMDGEKIGSFSECAEELDSLQEERRVVESSMNRLGDKIIDSDINNCYFNVIFYSEDDRNIFLEAIERAEPEINFSLDYILGHKEGVEGKNVYTIEDKIDEYYATPIFSDSFVSIHDYFSGRDSKKLSKKQVSTDIKVGDIVYTDVFDYEGFRIFEGDFNVYNEFFDGIEKPRIPPQYWWGSEDINNLTDIIGGDIDAKGYERSRVIDSIADYRYVGKDEFEKESYLNLEYPRINKNHIEDLSVVFSDALREIHEELGSKNLFLYQEDEDKKRTLSMELIKKGDFSYSITNASESYIRMEESEAIDSERDKFSQRTSELYNSLEGFEAELYDRKRSTEYDQKNIDGNLLLFKVYDHEESSNGADDVLRSVEEAVFDDNGKKVQPGDRICGKPESFKPNSYFKFEVVEIEDNGQETVLHLSVKKGLRTELLRELNWVFAKSESIGHVSDRYKTFLGQKMNDRGFEKITDRIIDGKSETKSDMFLGELDRESVSLNYEESDINNSQSDLIEYDGLVGIVQGPPGTGKTHTLARTIYERARVVDEKEGGGCFLVTGPTNKSIKELMEKLESFLDEKDDNIADKIDINSILTEVDREEVSKDIDEVNLEDDGITILFSTTARLMSVMNNLVDSMNTVQSMAEEGLFDLVIIDESSMLPLAKSIVPISFVKPDGQLLVCGDHRQLQPVQRREWRDENRSDVRKLVPYVSVMNYFRMFTDSPPEELDEYDGPYIPNEDVSTCGMVKFRTAYRYDYEKVLDLINNSIYEPMDNIELKFAGSEKSTEDGWRRNPLNVVIYDSEEHTKVNDLEKKISESIVTEISGNEPDLGVISPHRAQRANLRSSDVLDESTDSLKIDTVERFQGDEEQIVIYSTTVSSPSFIKKESNFILDMNRMNVAVSRTREQLFILAPRSIFTTVPRLNKDYKQRRLLSEIFSETDIISGREFSLESVGTKKQIDGEEYIIVEL